MTAGTYQVQAHIKGDNTLTGTWVEFYLLDAAPVEGVDPTNPIIAWKTFDACALTAMDSEITDVETCLEGDDIDEGKVTVTMGT